MTQVAASTPTSAVLSATVAAQPWKQRVHLLSDGYRLVIYSDGTNLVFRTSANGTSWSAATIIVAQSAGPTAGFDAVVAGSALYLVFYDANYSAYLIKFPYNGAGAFGASVTSANLYATGTIQGARIVYDAGGQTNDSQHTAGKTGLLYLLLDEGARWTHRAIDINTSGGQNGMKDVGSQVGWAHTISGSNGMATNMIVTAPNTLYMIAPGSTAFGGYPVTFYGNGIKTPNGYSNTFYMGPTGGADSVPLPLSPYGAALCLSDTSSNPGIDLFCYNPVGAAINTTRRTNTGGYSTVQSLSGPTGQTLALAAPTCSFNGVTGDCEIFAYAGSHIYTLKRTSNYWAATWTQADTSASALQTDWMAVTPSGLSSMGGVIVYVNGTGPYNLQYEDGGAQSGAGTPSVAGFGAIPTSGVTTPDVYGVSSPYQVLTSAPWFSGVYNNTVTGDPASAYQLNVWHQISVGGAPTSTLSSTGGTLAASTQYGYAYTYIGLGGVESALSATTSQTTGTGTTSSITVTVPVVPIGVQTIKIYRQTAGAGSYFLVGTVNGTSAQIAGGWSAQTWTDTGFANGAANSSSGQATVYDLVSSQQPISPTIPVGTAFNVQYGNFPAYTALPLQTGITYNGNLWFWDANGNAISAAASLTFNYLTRPVVTSDAPASITTPTYQFPFEFWSAGSAANTAGGPLLSYRPYLSDLSGTVLTTTDLGQQTVTALQPSVIATTAASGVSTLVMKNAPASGTVLKVGANGSGTNPETLTVNGTPTANGLNWNVPVTPTTAHAHNANEQCAVVVTAPAITIPSSVTNGTQFQAHCDMWMGTSGASVMGTNSSTVTYSPPSPPAPTGLTVSAVGNVNPQSGGYVQLTWSQTSGGDAPSTWNIYARTAASSPFGQGAWIQIKSGLPATSGTNVGTRKLYSAALDNQPRAPRPYDYAVTAADVNGVESVMTTTLAAYPSGVTLQLSSRGWAFNDVNVPSTCVILGINPDNTLPEYEWEVQQDFLDQWGQTDPTLEISTKHSAHTSQPLKFLIDKGYEDTVLAQLRTWMFVGSTIQYRDPRGNCWYMAIATLKEGSLDHEGNATVTIELRSVAHADVIYLTG